MHKKVHCGKGAARLYIMPVPNNYANRPAVGLLASTERGKFTQLSYSVAPDRLRIAPPLIITAEELAKACEVIVGVAGEVFGGMSNFAARNNKIAWLKNKPITKGDITTHAG